MEMLLEMGHRYGRVIISASLKTAFMDTGLTSPAGLDRLTDQHSNVCTHMHTKLSARDFVHTILFCNKSKLLTCAF